MKASNRQITQVLCAHALAIGFLMAPPAGAQPDLARKPDAGLSATQADPVQPKGEEAHKPDSKPQKQWLPATFGPGKVAPGMAAGGDGTDAAAAPNAARAIEKKDIRRGMVIAKPGSITPHTRTTSDDTPTNTLPPQSQEITIKEKSSHVRTRPNNAAQ